ncbi:MAG: HDOD domain-containing protein [Chthoniobacter sp.]|nr:HDOD domain-containing protein [Chthoniobacter sp.]
MTPIGIAMTEYAPTFEQRRSIAEALVDSTQSITVAPPVAFQVFMLTRGPDYTCEALVDLVSLDPALTAAILRLCNSVIFRGRGVSSLREAVLRIGNGVIAEKAMSITVGRLLAVRKTDYCPDPNAVWRHSVQTALACRYLSSYCEGVRWDPDLTFTAGLLHDIGKMVINSAPLADTTRILQLSEERHIERADAELEVLGADHAEIGGLILERWALPQEISQGVRFHHSPEFDGPGLANLVHVANQCAKINAGSKSWDEFRESLHPYSLDQLKLSLPAVEACWTDVLHDMDAIESFMWS